MLECLNADENKEVREFLLESGYSMRSLRAAFGNNEVAQLQMMKLGLMADSLEPNRLHTLFRWFWLGAPVEAAIARQWIPEHTLGLLEKSVMIYAEDGSFHAPVRISPFNQFLVLSDHGAARMGTLHSNTVCWPNPTSLTCYEVSMQSPVARTLDIGTGSGVLALSAAPHSGSVVATDLNPRAREFCLFNAALNGLTNVEFREGSSYEPVRGDRFDRILANPPFFVTPTVRRVYSDNSMELDGFCRTLVRQAPEHLEEGGYCQMLAEWVELKGQPWRERLGEWVSGLGCDAWVLTGYMRSILDYTLIRQQEDREELKTAEAQADLVRTWLNYFKDRGVESVYGGVIVLRRRSGRNWVRMEELPSPIARPVGEFMRRVFESRDYLESHPDEQLLESRPSAPATARLDKQFALTPEGWKLSSIDMRLTEGLPYVLALQPQVADFVELCDGKRTLAEIADRLAGSIGVDAAVVRREVCGMIRHLADRGMVVV